jgi:hypothetical protein
MRSALGGLSRSATDANIDAFSEAIAEASIARVNAMRRDLLARIRKGGDRQAVARLQAAVSAIEADMGGRIAERVANAAGRIETFEGAKAEANHWMAMEGVDPSSAMGLRRQTVTNETFLNKVAPGARKELVGALERTKAEMKAATTKEGKATLAAQLAEIRGKIKDLDGSVLGTEEEVAAAKRALPRQVATERMAGVDLADSLAGLTLDKGDDRAALASRLAEQERQMAEARATGDNAWLAEAAAAMKAAADGLRDFDDNQRSAGFDFDAAMAALTDGDADDRAVTQRRADDAQRRLNEALAAGDRDRATAAAIDLKGLKDALDANTAAQQEAAEQARQRMDLDRQLLESSQRQAVGAAANAAALARALEAIPTGGIGSSFFNRMGTPAVPGRTLVP